MTYKRMFPIIFKYYEKNKRYLMIIGGNSIKYYQKFKIEISKGEVKNLQEVNSACEALDIDKLIGEVTRGYLNNSLEIREALRIINFSKLDQKALGCGTVVIWKKNRNSMIEEKDYLLLGEKCKNILYVKDISINEWECSISKAPY
jgi:hypothetical protein